MKGTFRSSGKIDRWMVFSVVLLVGVIVGLGALGVACGSSETTAAGAGTTSTTQVVTTTPAVTTGEAVTTTAQAVTTTETAATTTTEAAGLDIQIVRNVRYMTQREGWIPALLDVYAPKQPGPWPVVVMLHGGGGGLDKTWLQSWATSVAQRGAVVFVPDWGRTEDPSTLVPAEFRADLITNVGDIAAAVRFARGTGTRYGGDPEQLTLFGHSAGAMQAAVEAFSGASASPGGLEGAGSATPDSLVLFDGDWLLADPMWDTFVTADPGFMKAESPWPYLGRRFDFPITVLGSGDTSLSRPLGDPWAKDSWLQVRDPSGDIRRGLEELGALAGDRYVNESVQQLLVERLKADGDTVTYVRFTDSKHTWLGGQGLAGLVDACAGNTRP